jgi:hypothetical protein
LVSLRNCLLEHQQERAKGIMAIFARAGKKIDGLLKIREEFLDKYFVREVGEGRVILNPSKTEEPEPGQYPCADAVLSAVLAIERTYLENRHEDDVWLGEDARILREVAQGANPERFIDDYCRALSGLSDNERAELRQRVAEQNAGLKKRKQLGGNADERVFRNITRSMIYETFRKDKEVSVMDVSQALGISYQQSYQIVIPWMKREGFEVKTTH